METKNKPEVMPDEDSAVTAFRNMHRALQYVNGAAADKNPIDQGVLKETHRRCMTGLLPETAAGRYRTRNVGISRASITPPDWQRVPNLMKAFSEELAKRWNSCGYGLDCLPRAVNTIAFAHYVFARIHPFEDGNGRTVRLLCDLLCKKIGLRPIIVWPSEREEYILALETVNRTANLANFEAFLIKCLMGRYEGAEGQNQEVFSRLSRLRAVKENEANQNNSGRFAQIWPVLEDPCFD